MAEGGEGEEEIQFLRTVRPAYFPFWEGFPVQAEFGRRKIWLILNSLIDLKLIPNLDQRQL